MKTRIATNDVDPNYSVCEFAGLTNLSTKTIYRYIKSGYIKKVWQIKKGTALRISATELANIREKKYETK